MAEKLNIFLLEDDLNFGTVLKSYLEINEFEVTWVDDGKNAISSFKHGDFDICLLDVMLPNIDGFTIAKEIRILEPNMPLVFLTSKTLKTDILEGFKIGADDYITKPFDSELLLMKIRAIIKRNTTSGAPSEPEKFKIGNYFFNHRYRTLSLGKQIQHLSPKEADLLRMLCLHKNSILPRENALKIIWGADNYFTTRSMDVYITKLRKYLKEDPRLEIENIHGSGFVFKENGLSESQ